jgi:hypothetical protein
VVRLEKPLRRQLSVAGKPFVLTVSPESFKLVGKGRRNGLELRWEDLASGEAALATALHASLDRKLRLEPAGEGKATRKKRRRVRLKAVRS